MKLCHVVAAGDNFPACLPEKGPEDLVVAADAGLLFLRENGIEPDLFVGDGDSLGFIPEDLPARILPVVKDDTDTQAALREGLARGYREFRIYGALGGRRLSHALANLSNLLFLAEAGARGEIVAPNCRVTLLLPGEARFSQEGGYFSLLPEGGPARVAIRGAKYEGEGLVLSPADSLGVSNEPRGAETVVTVLSGRALLIREP